MDFDFDPFIDGALIGLGYEAGQEDARARSESEKQSSNEPDCELPDDESLFEDVAAAAGLGYIDEREVAEEILRRKDEERKPIKVPLWTRHKVKGSKVSPALRAMYKVATGERTTKDPIEYTEEEQKQILDFESESDFEW